MIIDLSKSSLEAQFNSTSSSSHVLILSHPHPVYGGTMENKVIDQIYRRAVDQNRSVLRYNMRGIGESTGVFDHGLGEEQDLYELVAWVEQQPGIDRDRVLLVGYSFGSWITAKVAARTQKACVLIAPPISLFTFPILTSPKPKIIFSASNDKFVTTIQIDDYVATLSEPKKHVQIPDSDHYFVGTTAALTRRVFKTLEESGI